LKCNGGPMRFLLMINDDLVVAFASDEFPILEPRSNERYSTLSFVGAVILQMKQ
jgi:hypothetical protein